MWTGVLFLPNAPPETTYATAKVRHRFALAALVPHRPSPPLRPTRRDTTPHALAAADSAGRKHNCANYERIETMPTWHETYERCLDEGMTSEEAAAEADNLQ